MYSHPSFHSRRHLPPSRFRGLLVLSSFLPSLFAHGGSITSTVYAPPGNSYSVSASTGPVADEKMFSVDLGTTTVQTKTSGIEIVPLPKYPERGLFVVTHPLIVSAGVQVTNNSLGGALGARSDLRRQFIWRFDAIRPDLTGTTGTYRPKFKYSWDTETSRSQEGYAETEPSIVVNFTDGQNGRGFSRKALDPSRGGGFWTAEPIPFRFGQPLGGDFIISVATPANLSFDGAHGKCVGELELWSVDVFDASGNLLTRFSDFDWFEVGGNGSTVGQVAGRTQLGPEISITPARNGGVEVRYAGILQQSDDLETWQTVEPQPPSSFVIQPPLSSRRFFRSTIP